MAFAFLALMALLAACDDSDSREPAVATAEWSSDPLAAASIPGLPSGLPLPAVNPESIDETSNGGHVVSWLIPHADPGATAADLATRARNVTSVAVLAAELAATGGIVAFDAERAGHYLVTADPAGEGTRVELWLDPPATPTAAPPPAVTLPEGYPHDAVPVFPEATVIEAKREELPGGGERFQIAFVSARDAVEVLGFYADHLAAEGWAVVPSESGLEATRGTDAVRLEVDGDASTTYRITLERRPLG